MKHIGLRFVLKGGAFIGIVLPEQAALNYVAIFHGGGTPADSIWGGNGVPSADGTYWSVKICEVQAVHTFALPTPDAGTPKLGQPNGSGLGSLR